jgi:single-strand DNA-binding protein
MYSLNKAQVIGNVTRDPEVKETPNGKRVATFGVATNSSWTDKEGNKQEKVEFHNVVLWAKLAEIAEKFVKKGSKIFVEGRMETRTWDDKDGRKCYKMEIVGEELIMLDGKSAAPAAEESAADDFGAPETKPATAKKPIAQPRAEDEIKIEDIPF